MRASGGCRVERPFGIPWAYPSIAEPQRISLIQVKALRCGRTIEQTRRSCCGAGSACTGLGARAHPQLTGADTVLTYTPRSTSRRRMAMPTTRGSSA